jgi:hypothetical protein
MPATVFTNALVAAGAAALACGDQMANAKAERANALNIFFCDFTTFILMVIGWHAV